MNADHNHRAVKNPDAARVKVLQILEATTGGTGRHLWDLVQHLDPLRFELAVICSLRRDEAYRGAVERMRAQGIPVVEIPMLRRASPFGDVRALRRLRSHLSTTPADVVHVHSAKAGFLGRLAARRAGSRRVVYTPHGFPFQMDVARWRKWIYYRLERLAACWTDAFICVSREEMRLAASVVRGGVPPAVYIPNGVQVPDACEPEAARTRLASALGLPAGVPLVGSIGRLTRQKGLRYLVAAAGEMARSGSGAHVVFIGEGEERPSLETLTRKYGVGDRVHFLGGRPDAQALCAGLDVLAVPSLWEGLPYAVLDAMARRVPVVASCVGGLVDVIREAETGRFVPPADASALSSVILSLLADPAARRQMGTAGRETIRRDFVLGRMIERTSAVYRARDAS